MSGLSVFHRPQHPLIYNTSNKDDVTFRVVIVSRRTTMVSQIPHALSAQRHTTIKITMFSMRGSRSRLLIGSWRQLPRSRFGIVMPSIANQNLTNRFHVFVHLFRNRSQMVHLFACVLPVYMPISQRSCVRELRVWRGGGGCFILEQPACFILEQPAPYEPSEANAPFCAKRETRGGTPRLVSSFAVVSRLA